MKFFRKSGSGASGTALLLIAVFIAMIIFWVAGPRPDRPEYGTALPRVPTGSDSAESWLISGEQALPVKPGNDARIVWANDSIRKPTPVVIVYLHGFGASHEEGNPVHRNVAARFGCNLLLSRLASHGLDVAEPMGELTVDRLWQSALVQMALARSLGEKIVLMGTSTGGTLALKLAAAFPEVFAVVLYSPNIQINNSLAWLLNNPWGLHIARLSEGSREIVSDHPADWYDLYWYRHYRIEATVQLQEMLETAMVPEVFSAVKQPVLLLYYYKDDRHQDDVVRVDAMLDMFDRLGTDVDKKVKYAVPEAGDHVIGCALRSKDVAAVDSLTTVFFRKVLGMTPVDNPLQAVTTD